MTKINQLLILLVTHLFITPVLAQSQSDISLTNYLEQVQQTYETGSIKELKELFAFEGQQGLIDWIEEYELPRQSGEARVIISNEDSAIVLMYNMVTSDHPVVSTMAQSGLSGFYQLNKNEHGWHISDRIAIDRANRIQKHALDIVIDPGVAIKVIDTLLIDVSDPLGFWMTLNSKANVLQVILQGEKVDFTFQSGLLWVDKTDIRSGELIVTYLLDTVALNTSEQIRFAKEYAFLRQNFWHPMLKFGSTQDIADFSINVQIPADYQLTTSFPVTSQVRNGIRYIRSESTYPTSDLALLYDKEWEAEKHQHASMTFEIFATPDYKPNKDTLFKELITINNLLTEKFGPSQSDYLGVTQARVFQSSGWPSKTNSIITSSSSGTYNMIQEPFPKATVPHEVSHTWTTPTGSARMFLMEGWATFIENYFLGKEFGDSTVQAFWKHYKDRYLDKHDGKVSLWEDENNSGVSYHKGAWVLKILRDRLGEKTFEAGFKNYIQNTLTPDKDIYAFAKSMSTAAGFDVWPMLETWLKSRSIPKVRAFVQDGNLIVEQTGEDIFQFPLDIALMTNDGVRTQTYTIKEKKSQFPIKNPEEVTNVQVDPNDAMLLTIRE